MIEMKDLAIGYNNVPVLEHLFFSFKEENYALMGASGKGKTTLLLTLAQLIPKLHGEFKVQNHQTISFLFQEDRLIKELNCLQNVALVGNEQEAIKLLHALKIEQVKSKISDLSGGMKRRVALARALLYPSDILFLDEPFKGLDEDTKAVCAQQILNTKRHVILSTHDEKEGALLHAQIVHLEDMERKKV